MAEYPVAHGLDKPFGSLVIENYHEKLRCSPEKRNHDQCQCHDPKLLSQMGKSPECIYDPHDPCRIIRLQSSDGIVNRHTKDLRGQHVCQGNDGRSKDSQHKQMQAPFQEPHQMAPGAFLLVFCCFR